MRLSDFIPSWFRGVADKSPSDAGWSQKSFSSGGLFGVDATSIGSSQLSPSRAIQYYKTSAPVAIGVDMVSDAVSDITPVLYDSKANEYITSHDYLTLLMSPYPGKSWGEFSREICIQDVVTANIYLLLKGRRDRTPISIEVLSAAHVEANCGSSNHPESYLYTPSSGGSVRFSAQLDVRQSLMRYVSGELLELIPIHGPNPARDGSDPYGVSTLKAIYSEIEQLNAANLHNKSLLQRGARPGGFLEADKDVAYPSEPELNSLREQFELLYSGPSRAGRPAALPPGYAFKSDIASNRDMDWATLQKQLTGMVFSRLRIPLPLVSAENMTLSNYDTARLVFYQQSVLPTASRLLSILQRRMAHRWPRMEGLILTYDPASVSVTETRAIADVSILAKSGVMTINEMRTRLGYESIDGGDKLLAPTSMAPIGSDRYTDDNRDSPVRAKWMAMMRDQTEAKGLDIQLDNLWRRINGE